MSERVGLAANQGIDLGDAPANADASNDALLLSAPKLGTAAAQSPEPSAYALAQRALAQSTDAAVAVPQTAGAMLRAGREAAGLHIAALAVALKVPVKKLELLEADQFAELPDAVFVRALASSVCRTLKIDPLPVLAKLPHSSLTRLNYQQSSSPSFQSASASASGAGAMKLSRSVRWMAAVLLAAGVLLLLLPPWPVLVQQAQNTRKMLMDFVDTLTPVAAAPERVPVLESVALGQGTSAEAASPATAPPAAASAATAALLPVAPPAPTLRAALALPPSAPVAASAAAAPPASAAPVAAGLVSFRAKGESWVEVVDKRGAVVLRKLLLPGETVGATGTLPLIVTVGRADLTEIQVRGQAFDTQALRKDNVARFEIR